MTVTIASTTDFKNVWYLSKNVKQAQEHNWVHTVIVNKLFQMAWEIPENKCNG